VAAQAPGHHKERKEATRIEIAQRARFRRRGLEPARRSLQPPSITEGYATESVRGREGIYRHGLALADAAVAVLVLSGVVAIAQGGFEPVTLLAIPLILLMNKVAGLYDRDELVLNKSTLDEAPALVQIGGIYALITWLLHSELSAVNLRPGHVLLVWFGGVLALIAGRSLARYLARRMSPTERCLLVGEPESIRTLQEKLKASHLKAEVVAALPIGTDAATLPAGVLRELVMTHDIHRVVIAPSTTDSGEMLDLVRMAKSVGVRVSVLPRLFEVVGSAVEFDQLDGLVVLGVRRFGLTRSSRWLKRGFDLVGGTLLVLVLSPILAAIALAIKLESRGPVLFRQTRVGRDGQRFEIFKFRSMVDDAEARKGELMHLNEASGLFKIAEDPRITRVGRIIRKASLDELPQLLNVMRGEMSLVGPRPLVTDEDARVEGHYRSRLHLTPGMTGHWQILGSARVPLHEMVGIDYLYVANWSLWSDLKILLRTVPYVIARRGM
jgi:exopolysaccharide biosynthesis polyprenyl glycosylphosphotransferase